jgi:hypothetical protein
MTENSKREILTSETYKKVANELARIATFDELFTWWESMPPEDRDFYGYNILAMAYGRMHPGHVESRGWTTDYFWGLVEVDESD